MTTFLRRRERVHVECYELSFESTDLPGAGYSFPCDKDGNILYAKMPHREARENLALCLSGMLDVTPQGVRDCSWDYWEPAQICCCGCRRIVTLDHHFTNTCLCGYDYNGSGQLLAPRSQWEEDY